MNNTIYLMGTRCTQLVEFADREYFMETYIFVTGRIQNPFDDVSILLTNFYSNIYQAFPFLVIFVSSAGKSTGIFESSMLSTPLQMLLYLRKFEKILGSPLFLFALLSCKQHHGARCKLVTLS